MKQNKYEDTLLMEDESLRESKNDISLITEHLLEKIDKLNKKTISYDELNTIIEDYEFSEETYNLFVERLLEEKYIISNEKIIENINDIENELENNEIASASGNGYFHEIKGFPLLNPEEEHKLAVKYFETGDLATRDKLIHSNLRLVIFIAKKYINKGLSFMDLVQEGNVGLQKAIDKFDPYKGTKISTFAYGVIRQRILRSIANLGKTIRIPVYLTVKNNKIMRAEQTLTQELGREPKPKEIEDFLKDPSIKEDDIILIRLAMVDPVSLSTLIGGDDSDTTIEDLVADENEESPVESANKTQHLDNLYAIMSILDEREKDIILYRYGFKEDRVFTLQELSVKYNISKERVRQLEARALNKIKNNINN